MNRIDDNMTLYVEELIHRYPVLGSCKNSIVDSYIILKNCFENGGKLLVAGNGGSASDADHIVGELMKGFCLSRKIDKSFSESMINIDKHLGNELSNCLQGALPTIALSNHNSLNTAFLNDVDGLMCYAQQIMGYGAKNDVFWGISTSGNSKNVIYAAITAKAKGMKVIGLTGESGGKLRALTDICINVAETETYKVQELHLPIYHCLCMMLEKKFFDERG